MMFKDFKPGDLVQAYALVHDFKLRYTVNQTPYYGLTLSDGEVLLDARLWDVNMKKDLTSGRVYEMTLQINDFGGKNQAIIKSIVDVDENEIKLEDFYRFAPLKRNVLEIKIFAYVDKIKILTLKNLVSKILNDHLEKYFTYPAGVTMHHNYISGLAYHVYSMLLIADRLLEIYPSLNSDLLYAGIMLHDIGKVGELSEARQPQYTLEGNLIGHLIIGFNIISLEAEKQGIEKNEEVQALMHLILAHHGELQYGSPKEPLIMEAQALYFIDLLDSKMGALEDEVVKTEQGNWTNPIPSLNKKTLYVPILNDKENS